MRRTARTLAYVVAILALGAGTPAPAWSQQPAPATKVTALMKQVMADFPGREVVMVTLDIPPGGGSAPHRHPGHHIFGYVLEGSYKLKLDQGPGNHPHQRPDLLRGARATARGVGQCQPDRARQGARRHRGGERQADHRA